MWASDCTESMKPELSDYPSSWGETLFWLRGTEEISSLEKEWILGRTVRTVLRWPGSAQACRRCKRVPSVHLRPEGWVVGRKGRRGP